MILDNENNENVKILNIDHDMNGPSFFALLFVCLAPNELILSLGVIECGVKCTILDIFASLTSRNSWKYCFKLNYFS